MLWMRRLSGEKSRDVAWVIRGGTLQDTAGEGAGGGGLAGPHFWLEGSVKYVLDLRWLIFALPYFTFHSDESRDALT